MKQIFITLSLLAALSADAQLQFIDLTTRTTNTVTGAAQITISGVCTAAPYTVTNTQNIVIGDPIPTAFGKVNSDFNYLSNQLVQTLNLPNQINTNLNAYIILESNRVNAVVLTNTGLSSGLDGTRYAITNFLGTNRVTADFYNFLVTNVPGLVAGGAMNFDGGDIYSDGPNGPGVIDASIFEIPGSWYDDLSSDGSGGELVDFGANSIYESTFDSTHEGAFFRIDTRSGFSSSQLFDIFDIPNDGSGDVNGVYQVGNDGSTLIGLGFYGGSAPSQGLAVAGEVGVGIESPAYELDIAGGFGDSSDGTYSMDSGGNLTCTGVTQTSDVNSKTNIVAFDTAGALANLLSLPVYKWNFKDQVRTNYRPQTVYATNIMTVTNVVQRGTNTLTVARQKPVRIPIATNLMAVVRTNILSNTPHIGPMAQDWSARFGGKTNAISIIDMQGVLLAGEQALADPARVQTMPFLKLADFTVAHSTNSTFGYGAGLVACDANFIYVSTGTNAWRRVALGAGSW